MSKDSLTFECGGFLPGKQPVNGPIINLPGGGYAPIQGRRPIEVDPPIRLPIDPIRPPNGGNPSSIPWYECTLPVVTNPPAGLHRVVGRCDPCNPLINANCVHRSLAACLSVCYKDIFTEFPRERGPATPRGPNNGGGGGGGTGPPTGGSTSATPDRWRCIKPSLAGLQPGQIAPGLCVNCRGETNQYVLADCFHRSQEDCKKLCFVIVPGGDIEQPSSFDRINTITPYDPKFNSTQNNVGTISYNAALANNVETRNHNVALSLNISERQGGQPGGGPSENLYSPANFFQSNLLEEFVSNYLHLNLFADKVDFRISKLLTLAQTSGIWHEGYFNFSNDVLERSLSLRFSEQINSIKNLDGTRFDKRKILESIREHLIHGTIDQFDHWYISNLATDSGVIQITPGSTKQEEISFALNYAERNAVPIDSDKLQGPQKELVKLTKPLYPDVGSYIPIIASGECGTQKLYLDYAGIPIYCSGGEQLWFSPLPNLNLGFSACGEQMSLQVVNQVKNAYTLTSKDSQLLEKILGVRFNLAIEASCPLSSSEFGTYDLSTPRTPMFYKLDLQSVESRSNTNLVDTTTTRFIKVDTSSAGINDYAKFRWGSVIYMHYNDPMLNYMNSTSSVFIEFNNFSTESLVDVRDEETSRKLFVKQIPWFFIIAPCLGRLNPLGIQSTLTKYDSDVIFRKIELAKHMDSNLGGESLLNVLPGLRQENTYPSTNIDDVVTAQGLKNTIDFTSVDFSSLYYHASGYSSDEPQRTLPPIGKLVNKITDIRTTYTLSGGLNWFDILSRMDINSAGSLLQGYDINKNIVTDLMNAQFVNVPIKIFHSYSGGSNKYITRIGPLRSGQTDIPQIISVNNRSIHA